MKKNLATMSFCAPIIRALQDSGGKAKAGNVIDVVIQSREIGDEDCRGLKTQSQEGIGVINNRIRWARQHLVGSGYLIRDSDYGYWELSDKGAKFAPDHDDDFSRGTKQQQPHDDKPPPGEEHHDRLRNTLLGLEHRQFELVCMRLLTEMGFESMRVTPDSHDGGFDGVGYLAVNPVVKIKIIVECKRHKGSVGVAPVRSLQSAIDSKGKAERGVIITTSFFTSAAKKEVSEGKPNIELIDGDALADLFVKYRLGVRVKEHLEVEVDEAFFDKFRP